MALRFPFYGLPFPYNRYNYYNPHKYKPSTSTYNYSNNNSDDKENTSYNKNNVIKQNSSYNKDNVKDEYFFDLFGIHLYFDDILLICLIFFLYNEGVKDEGLFMALILLLLT